MFINVQAIPTADAPHKVIELFFMVSISDTLHHSICSRTLVFLIALI